MSASAPPGGRPPLATARSGGDDADYSADKGGFRVELWEALSPPAERNVDPGVYVNVVPVYERDPKKLAGIMKKALNDRGAETISEGFPEPERFTANDKGAITFFVPYTEMLNLKSQTPSADKREAFLGKLKFLVDKVSLVTPPAGARPPAEPTPVAAEPTAPVEQSGPEQEEVADDGLITLAAAKARASAAERPAPRKPVTRRVGPIGTVVGVAQDACLAAYEATFGKPEGMDDDIIIKANAAARKAFRPERIAGYDDHDYDVLANAVLAAVHGEIGNSEAHAIDRDRMSVMTASNVEEELKQTRQMTGPKIIELVKQNALKSYDTSGASRRPDKADMQLAVRDRVAGLYTEDQQAATPGFDEMVNELADEFVKSYGHLRANPAASRAFFSASVESKAKEFLGKSNLGGAGGGGPGAR